MKIKSRNIYKSVAIVAVFSVFTRGISFLFKIYLSRKVGAEVMGLYQIAVTAFYLFAGITAGGLSTVLSRRTAQDFCSGSNKSFSLTTTALIIGGVASILIIALIYLLKDKLGFAISDERAIPLFLIMTPALFTTTIYNVIRAYFWGKKDFTSFSITETLEEVFRILFTALFVSGIVSSINGAKGIAFAFTASDILVAILPVILFFAKGGKLKKPTEATLLIKSSLPVTGVRVFGSMVGMLLAIILPSGLVSAGYTPGEATAVFGRITGMANPLLFAPNAIISSLLIVLIPEISASKARGDMQKLLTQFNTGTTFSVVISGAFMAVYLSLGQELCGMIFHDVDAGKYLEIASLLMILAPINSGIANTLNSIGLEKECFYCFILGTALLIPSVFLLTPYIGMYSVVVGNGLSLISSIILGTYYLRKHTSLTAKLLIAPAKTALSVIPAFFIGENVMALLAGKSKILGVIASGASAEVFYFVTIILLGTIDIKGLVYGKITKIFPKLIVKKKPI